MQARAGHYQLKMPSFLAKVPTQWAIENNWLCAMRKPGAVGAHHPHVSFVHASLVAYVASLPRAQRQALLLKGARLVFAGETRENVPGRERVRLYQSDTVRPAGIASRAA